MSLEYLPSIKPSALAIGALYTHASSFVVYGPLFGQIWHKAMQQDKSSEYREREAGVAATTYVSSVAAAVVQSYAVGALITVTGTLSYKGAAYLGGLLFCVNAAPSAVHSVFVEKRPLEYVLVKAAANILETVGLSMVLVWWGPRTSPF